MQKRVEGKKVLLFIDDAQNLNADVLEQVRLLSNLETTREKLLQIVLVGEPELADMLGSRALRQIGQRVSVSYYIKPLTYEETCAYIYHRMSIASRGAQTHFTSSALKRIYKFSGGIPRMINIACDKALFNAHRLNHSHITGDIAQSALRGLAPGSDRPGWGFLNKRRALAAAGGCGLLLILILVAVFPWQADQPAVGLKIETQPTAAGPAEQPDVAQPPAPKAPKPMAKVDPTVVEGSSNAMDPDKPAPPPAADALPEAPEAVEKPADSVPSSPMPDKPPEPEIKMTHSVQVGAFRRMPTARKLVIALKQKGYPASIFPVYDSQNRTWFTVRIGDYRSREAAVQSANEFTSREKMETAVRPFEKL
jgi:general secretion pathway protein A